MIFSEAVVESMKTYLEKQDYTFSYDAIHGMFSVEADLACELRDATVVFQATEDGFICYTTIFEEAAAEIRSMVGEYLHRANYGLPRGNFEFDYDSGEIHYKTYFTCPDGVVTEAQMDDAFGIGLTVFDHYGNGLYQLLHGTTQAKQLIDGLEEQ